MSLSNNSASEFFNHLENEREAESDALNAEWEAQLITSAATSLNQVPAGLKKLAVATKGFGSETANLFDYIDILDFGGGKYDTASQWVKEKYPHTTLYVYDPFNRSKAHNGSILAWLDDRRFDFITCFNVLNVLHTNALLCDTISEIYAMADSTIDKVAYISVYEGDKTGNGKETTKGYQRNEKIAEYVPVLEMYFSEVSLKNGLLTCRV